MDPKRQKIHILGAGPAGLIAAIRLARGGYETVVYEQHSDVGSRFNGDFQGIENWSTSEDAQMFLKRMGIELNFTFVPYWQGYFFDSALNRFEINPKRPLFYLIERGEGLWSFDQGLKRQALAAGVKFRWNHKITRIRSKNVISATGPKAADVIAKGIVFQTSYSNAYFGFLDDWIAPKGYAYLLVYEGKATFATCLFEDFKHERLYYERARKRMKSLLNIDIQRAKEFGGFGNFFLPPIITRKDHILYVGENAGFQDALWGFGIRHALTSGYLAAESIITARPYDALVQEKILPALKTSLANRWFYTRLGNKGYEFILNRLGRKDVIEILKKHHQYTLTKKIGYGISRYWYHSRLVDKQCLHRNCHCVWCRCGKQTDLRNEKEIEKKKSIAEAT